MLRYPDKLIVGKLKNREKRFLSYITLENGEEIVAHCPNPGKMTGALGEDRAVALSYNPSPKRKLQYTWELTATNLNDSNIVWSGINTNRANNIIEHCIKFENIKSLQHITSEISSSAQLKREVKYAENHRADFAIINPEISQLIEVKSVHMSRKKGVAEFPDSITSRGTKHLQAFTNEVAQGKKCTVIFCVQRPDCQRLEIAKDIDIAFYNAAQTAANAGVKFVALDFELSLDGIKYLSELKIPELQ